MIRCSSNDTGRALKTTETIRSAFATPSTATQASHVSYGDDDETYSFLVDIGEQTPSLGSDPELDKQEGEQVLVDMRWLCLREIPERDRSFLWAAGLLGVSDFASEVIGWGHDRSYPEGECADMP